MEKKEINTKTNRWGVLMCATAIITTGFYPYPLMRQYILSGIVVIILSGLMAFREVDQLGWPTYEGSARWNAEMKNETEEANCENE